MWKPVLAAACALLCLALLTPAGARPHRHHRHAGHHGRLPWCGIYLGQYLGKPDRRLWIAREWASEGSRAAGPDFGVVVVWPHHVGIIVGRAGNGEWIVHSGNDGGAVKTRARSVAGAIAFRRV
jgi:hypothetical protein